MAFVSDIRLLNGGMNLDDSIRIIPNGDYGIARNFRSTSSESNKVGNAESVMGNTLKVPEPVYSSLEEYKCIGVANDYKNNALIYFLYGSLDNHRIYRYYPDTGLYEIIAKGSILNFKDTNLITHANVIDDLLFWTDNYDEGFGAMQYNPPRKLNIIKALNYTTSLITSWTYGNAQMYGDRIMLTGGGNHNFHTGQLIYISDYGTTTVFFVVNNKNIVIDIPFLDNTLSKSGIVFPYETNKNNQYYELTEGILDRIKYPPVFSPIATYDTDDTKLYNYLKETLFQFRYRYVYDDNERSVWSPISKVALPFTEMFTDGTEINAGISEIVNNMIKIAYNTGSFEVVAIEIAIRSGNTGYWKTIDRIEKFDIDGYELIRSGIENEYYFYNDIYGDVIDQNEVNTLFHSVPQISACQEVIEHDRLIDANYVEGYDAVRIDANIEYEIKHINAVSNLSVDFITHPYPPDCEYIIYNHVYPGYLYSIEITLSTGDVDKVTYQSLDTDTNLIIVQALKSKIEGLYGYVCVMSVVNPNTIWLRVCNSYAGVSLNAVAKSVAINTSGFKTGAEHEWGIVYYDRANRSGSVNVSSQIKKYIPFYTEIDSLQGADGIGIDYAVLKWEINHLPPMWATHYQWVYTKNTSLSYFLQMSISSIDNTDTGTEIDVNTIILDYMNVELPRTSGVIGTYIFETGDRIRFKAIQVAGNKFRYLDEYLDYPIEKQDPETGKITIQKIEYSDYDIGLHTIIEIYRPVKKYADETTKIYYEWGEEYEIENPHTFARSHQGGRDDGTGYARNQGGGLSARGIFLDGDIYTKFRPVTKTTALLIPVEDFNFSDFFVSKVTSEGRINIINRSMRRMRYNTGLRFGGKYFPGTQVNDLCVFNYANYNILPNKYGSINKILEIGYSLKVIHEYKRVSIFIGRAGLQQAQELGVDIVASITEVLGTWYPWVDEYGCKNPESCVRKGNSLYFVDINNGKIIKDATNGGTPVSDIKVKDWVRDTLKSLKENYTNVKIIGGVDNKHDEILFTFYGESSGGNYCETIFFNEAANRWKGFLDHKNSDDVSPSYYGSVGDYLVSFMKGALWLHNNNVLHANFYGVQHSPVINIITNGDPLKVKTYNSIALNVNEKCNINITIEKSGVYTQGMFSKIFKADWVNKEGVYYANFKRDMYTHSPQYPAVAVADIHNLYNGRQLKGQVANLELDFDTSNEVILFSINIMTTPSERSGAK